MRNGLLLSYSKETLLFYEAMKWEVDSDTKVEPALKTRPGGLSSSQENPEEQTAEASAQVLWVRACRV